MKREGRSVISFIDLVRVQRSQKNCEKTNSRIADHFYIQSSLYIILLFVDSMKIVTTKSGQNSDRMREERSSTEVAIFFIDLVRVQRNQTDCQNTSYNSEFQTFVSNQSYKLFSYSSIWWRIVMITKRNPEGSQKDRKNCSSEFQTSIYMLINYFFVRRFSEEL